MLGFASPKCWTCKKTYELKSHFGCSKYAYVNSQCRSTKLPIGGKYDLTNFQATSNKIKSNGQEYLV